MRTASLLWHFSWCCRLNIMRPGCEIFQQRLQLSSRQRIICMQIIKEFSRYWMAKQIGLTKLQSVWRGNLKQTLSWWGKRRVFISDTQHWVVQLLRRDIPRAADNLFSTLAQPVSGTHSAVFSLHLLAFGEMALTPWHMNKAYVALHKTSLVTRVWESKKEI